MSFCSELFEAWKAWCEPKGMKPGTDQTFGRDLRAAKPGIESKQERFGSMRFMAYLRHPNLPRRGGNYSLLSMILSRDVTRDTVVVAVHRKSAKRGRTGRGYK